MDRVVVIVGDDHEDEAEQLVLGDLAVRVGVSQHGQRGTDLDGVTAGHDRGAKSATARLTMADLLALVLAGGGQRPM